MSVDGNAFFVILGEKCGKGFIDRMMAMADKEGRLLPYPRSYVIFCVFRSEIFKIQLRTWFFSLLLDVL